MHIAAVMAERLMLSSAGVGVSHATIGRARSREPAHRERLPRRREWRSTPNEFVDHAQDNEHQNFVRRERATLRLSVHAFSRLFMFVLL